MEELQAALKGNELRGIDTSSLVCDASMSVDSLDDSFKGKRVKSMQSNLDVSCSSASRGGQVESFYISNNRQDFSATKSNEIDFEEMAEMSPFISISCDQMTTSNNSKSDYAMKDYLNSYRHSISSVLEFAHFTKGSRDAATNSESSLTECIPELQQHEIEQSEEDVERVYIEEQGLNNSYFLLSPIEENSEQSTGSNSSHDNFDLKANKKIFKSPQLSSVSCDPLPCSNSFPDYHLTEKYQTFPRSKIPIAQINREATLYPLEPRELDPAAFHQLHTADSQEELQEFLLLESECMTGDRNRGLATAFVLSDQESQPSAENIADGEHNEEQ